MGDNAPEIIHIPNGPYVCLYWDNSITLDIFRHDCRLDWDDRIRQIVSQYVGPGSIVLDIGAYIGDTTKIFLDLGCFVHAFEPRADAYFCLKHNCNAHPQARKATLWSCVVGNGKENVQVSHQRCGNLGAQPVANDIAWEKVDQNQYGDSQATKRLDDLGFHSVDFIKLDVEGYEPAVLAGMERILKNCKPKLLIEINKPALNRFGWSSDDVWRYLPVSDWRRQCVVGNGDEDRTDWLVCPR